MSLFHMLSPEVFLLEQLLTFGNATAELMLILLLNVLWPTLLVELLQSACHQVFARPRFPALVSA